MVENTISQLTPIVKNTDDIRFLSIGSMPAVLSTDVARHFQRRHSHVLREIDRLRSILPKSFREPNFGLTFRIVPGPNEATRKEKAYLLTRDALSLLVMGFTGKAAIMWKLRYIEAFNTMEQALHENIRREARTGGKEAIHTACEKARQETAQLFWRLGPVQKRRVRQAVRYHAMGLGKHSIAKLLDVDGREVSRLLKAAQALGVMELEALGEVFLGDEDRLAGDVSGRGQVVHARKGHELTGRAVAHVGDRVPARALERGRNDRDAKTRRQNRGKAACGNRNDLPLCPVGFDHTGYEPISGCHDLAKHLDVD